MMLTDKYPILEYDNNREAKVNPIALADKSFETDKLVLTFFPEVMDKLKEEGKISLERTIPGENPIQMYRFLDSDVLITLGFVGCPACAGNLDMFHAMGIKKVMFCGGGGVLDSCIDVGQVLVVDGAIRDEGFSYHYIEPSKYIFTEQNVTEKIVRYLEEQSVPHLRGIVWTTDAIFRETEERIARRKEEGAKIVEMEQAGCIAVAQFRGFDYGALIYGGDDVTQEEWDNREWRNCEGIRYNLVLLCERLVQMI